MAALRDPQQERFARELVEQYLKVPPAKRPEFEAYTRAGYRAHHGNPGRLARQPQIKARVAELMDEAREYLDIRPVKALVRVDRIADASLPDFYETLTVEGENGERREITRLRDITRLPRVLAEAISEIEFHDDGRVKKIKLHDKLHANITLLKHFGTLPEEAPAAQVNIFNALSPEDQRVLADALDALERGQAGTIEAVAQTPSGSGEEA